MKHVRFRLALHLDGVCIQKLGGAAKQINSVAAQLVAHDTGFPLHHLRDPGGQIADRNAILYDVVASVERAMAKSSEAKNCFTQGLAANGSPMHANSPDHVVSIPYRHSFAEFRYRHRALLTCALASH